MTPEERTKALDEAIESMSWKWLHAADREAILAHIEPLVDDWIEKAKIEGREEITQAMYLSAAAKYNPDFPAPEPPVGTWVKGRNGYVTYHQTPGGWGEPGIMPFGRWASIWAAWGPLIPCKPWGKD